MALKQANTLAPSNVSATGFALADARHIGGHKVVASLTALYALQDWQLLNPGETDTALALGQQWYVKGIGFYRLTNWANRKTSSGWIKEVDPNNIDTTLFQIVSALPTSGINKNRIYLVASANRDPNGKNIYAEYIYTGDTSATYDATKWEKIGEYTPTVDLSPYMKLEQKGVANGVATLDAKGKVTDSQLWDATSEKHGLMSATDKERLDGIIENIDNDTYSDVYKFNEIFTPTGDVEILNQSVFNPSDYPIVYLTTKKQFAIRKDGKYYQGTMSIPFRPIEGKLYMQVSKTLGVGVSPSLPSVGSQSPILYTSDGKDIYPLVNEENIEVMSNEDIDALFT